MMLSGYAIQNHSNVTDVYETQEVPLDNLSEENFNVIVNISDQNHALRHHVLGIFNQKSKENCQFREEIVNGLLYRNKHSLENNKCDPSINRLTIASGAENYLDIDNNLLVVSFDEERNSINGTSLVSNQEKYTLNGDVELMDKANFYFLHEMREADNHTLNPNWGVERMKIIATNMTDNNEFLIEKDEFYQARQDAILRSHSNASFNSKTPALQDINGNPHKIHTDINPENLKITNWGHFISAEEKLTDDRVLKEVGKAVSINKEGKYDQEYKELTERVRKENGKIYSAKYLPQYSFIGLVHGISINNEDDLNTAYKKFGEEKVDESSWMLFDEEKNENSEIKRIGNFEAKHLLDSVGLVKNKKNQNVATIQVGPYLTLYATKPIKAGEELKIHYQ